MKTTNYKTIKPEKLPKAPKVPEIKMPRSDNLEKKFKPSKKFSAKTSFKF